MPKIKKGRLDGIDGMKKRSADELFAWADKHESQINDPSNIDDPRWLKR